MTATRTAIANPYYAARIGRKAEQPKPYLDQPVYAKLPRAPRNASPVPHLTSLYHFSRAGDYGDRSYPGNCGGNLIKDLLKYFKAYSVYDPMTGSGTCRDVCRELGLYCWSSDLKSGADACDPAGVPQNCFDFCWIHPPYWRQKVYSENPLDLSQAPTLDAFLDRYRLLIVNCASAVRPGGIVAILMGDYNDRHAGFVPLVYHTKRLAFEYGLKQHGTDIIRFSHGASSSK
ncbi:MAG: hypothetical protein JSS02_14300, partial [Planctomycetes bacterium]|nr:hypothetical protein [Planctomycetota bacterium]